MPTYSDGMVDIRHLSPTDLQMIGEIDRSEHVTVHYVVDDGDLTARPVDWEVPTFDPVGTGEHSVHELVEHWRPVLDRGASLVGAFADDHLLGLAIVEPSFEPVLAWLAFLHVSRSSRRSGVATALWTEATVLAADARADSMYVSAAPSGSAVGFYLSRGCTLAHPPHPTLFEEEPDDVHLICPVAR